MTLVCLITRSTARRADAGVTFSRGGVCHIHSARTWAEGQSIENACLSNRYYSEKFIRTIMPPGWLSLFFASVHVLLQAGIVRSEQLEMQSCISMSEEVDSRLVY